MNPFEHQTDLMSNLAQLMVDQVNTEYDWIICEYEYLAEFNTIISSLKTVIQDVEHYPEL